MPSTIHALNRDLALKINAEARSNPQSPYANKFVGIANGQVVAVADTLQAMVRRLRQVEPDPTKTLCVEASEDLDRVHDGRAAERAVNKNLLRFTPVSISPTDHRLDALAEPALSPRSIAWIGKPNKSV
jgi:hypothetical protein